jgi:putative membrane protein
MLAELILVLLATAVGVLAGIITGLLPGVHINLVSAILYSLAPIIALHMQLFYVAILIVAMSVTHTFLDTIPSIFLGAPSEGDVLGILPGHRYLLAGNGMMAVKLSVVGGILGSIVAVACFTFFASLIEISYTTIKPYLFWCMLAIIIFMIGKDAKPFLALAVFLYSGLFGLVALRLPLQEVLLPMLSGMFGVATLLYSINENQDIPKQNDEQYTQLRPIKTIHGCVSGTAAGFITALLPGVSAAAASAVTSQGGKLGDHGFMVLLGSLGSASFILSLASFVSIEKARNGAMAVVTSLVTIDTKAIIMLLSVALIATGTAAVITIWMSRFAAQLLPKLPYAKTCVFVIIFVMCIVFWRTGWLGLCILITSTAIGLMPAALRTARAQAMGCLLLPLLVLLW